MGIGTNKLGGDIFYDHTDPSKGKNFVKRAIDLGINFIDTADMYTGGHSEEYLGQLLREEGILRQDIVIATKGGNQRLNNGEVKINNKPDYLRGALESSLRRLRQDYVDLYYLHFPDEETPISESIGELNRLKEEGKIRAIGVSNLNMDQLKQAVNTAEISALQSGYNMIDRSVEKEILPYCIENQISFIPYFPLASGILSGKYTQESRFHDQDPRKRRFQGDEARKKFEIAEKLKGFAEKKGTSLPLVALSWLLSQKGIDAVIPGGRRPEQAEMNVEAVDIHLTNDDLETIDTLVGLV